MDLASTISKRVSYPVWDLYDRSVKLNEWRRLERDQWEPLEANKARQWSRLQFILKYARENCEFYRERLPASVSSSEEFRQIPLLRKDDVQEHSEPMLARGWMKSELIEARTGGSTSKALRVWFDKSCQERRNAAALRCDRWSGWELGDWKGALWGNPPVATTVKQRIRNTMLDRTIYLDTISMSQDSMADFVRRLREKHVRFLFGHSHSLFVFANFVQSQRIQPLFIRGIVSTSMMLLDEERKAIESAFGCPVTDRYGCEEVGLIACECERHQGMHINIDHHYVEVLRDDGAPADPGEDGRLVVTDLINRGMPFVRYEVGDISRLSTASCRCGRGLPLLGRITGRTADFLVRADGSLVAGVSLVERTLTAFAGLKQLQIVQDHVGELMLNVVADPEYDTVTETNLVRSISEAFGPDATIRVAKLDALPQEQNGKYRFAICRVPHRYTTLRLG